MIYRLHFVRVDETKQLRYDVLVQPESDVISLTMLQDVTFLEAHDHILSLPLLPTDSLITVVSWNENIWSRPPLLRYEQMGQEVLDEAVRMAERKAGLRTKEPGLVCGGN